MTIFLIDSNAFSFRFNGEPKSVQPPKRVVATNKDDMPDISFDKSDEEDYDKTLLQEEQV